MTDIVFSNFVTIDDGLVLPNRGFFLDFESVTTPGTVYSFPSWLTFTRASDQYTVQTSASTMTSGLTGNDKAYTGNRGGISGRAWSNGLSFEESRQQLMNTNPRSITTLNVVGTVTSVVTGVGPDGGGAPERVQAASGQYSRSGSFTINASSSTVASQWLIQGSAGALNQFVPNNNGVIYAVVAGPAGSSWNREIAYIKTGGSTAFYLIPCDGRSQTTYGGIAAGARDAIFDFLQIEYGFYPTEAIPTASATRQAPALTATDRTKVLDATGRLYWVADITFSGSTFQYAAPIQVSPYFDASNAGASISNSTNKLSVNVGGNTWTPTTDLSYHLWAGRRAKLGIVAGGGGVVSKAKIQFQDNGTVLDLGSSSSPQAAIPLTGSYQVIGNAGSNVPTGLIHSVSSPNAEPSWFSGGTPTWNPAALTPSAWFRSDLGISTATGVSQWNDLTGNGHNATQGTGANQPIYARQTLTGKPGLIFPVTTAMLTAAGTLDCSGDFTLIVVCSASGVLKVDGSYCCTFAGTGTGGAHAIYSLYHPNSNVAPGFVCGGVTLSTGIPNTPFGVPHLLTLSVSAGTVTWRTQNTTGTMSRGTPGTITGYLGNVSAVQPHNGTLHEVLFVNRALSTGELASEIAYLNNFHGGSWT